MNAQVPFAMTSHRPYLIRALHGWIEDNNCTPHILVDATVTGVRVPKHAVKDGRIVLNLAYRAVNNMSMDNDGVSFNARFNGKSESIFVPIDAIRAIYARENGEGMALPPPDVTQTSQSEVEVPVDSAPATAVSVASDAPLAPIGDTLTREQNFTPQPGMRRVGHLTIVK